MSSSGCSCRVVVLSEVALDVDLCVLVQTYVQIQNSRFTQNTCLNPNICHAGGPTLIVPLHCKPGLHAQIFAGLA